MEYVERPVLVPDHPWRDRNSISRVEYVERPVLVPDHPWRDRNIWGMYRPVTRPGFPIIPGGIATEALMTTATVIETVPDHPWRDRNVPPTQMLRQSRGVPDHPWRDRN